MTRNLCVEDAKHNKADFLVMIDNDMSPDLKGEKPFWDTSWDSILKPENQPCIIAAPYCGPPPL